MLIPLEVLRVAYQENVKWIVPPGLATTVKQFKNALHNCNEAANIGTNLWEYRHRQIIIPENLRRHL